MSSSTSPSSDALSTRIAHFFSTHRQTVLISTLAIALAGGSTYYLLANSGRAAVTGGTRGSDEGEGGEGGEVGADGKKKRKGKRKGGKKGEKDGEASEEEGPDPLKLTTAEIEALPSSRRKSLALELKTRGNRSYSTKNYKEALELYSKALECEKQAVFFSNRAACYTNLGDTASVIQDCTSALELDPTYVKALNRRAQAKEAMGGKDDLYEALCDFTAAAILDQFRNESTAQSVDRVMKILAAEKATEILKTRELRLPSPTFIKAYLEAFRPRSPPPLPENPTESDLLLERAFTALTSKDYQLSYDLAIQAIQSSSESSFSSEDFESESRNMRGTFRFIMGDAKAALDDLDWCTGGKNGGEGGRGKKDRDVQAWVKKASVHMELGDPTAAFQDFEEGININSNDADIYYHRGQVFFIMGQFSEAMENYKKSIEIDSSFIFSHIQLAVSQYKAGQVEKAMHLFRKYVRDFDDNPEVHNYFGELLLDQRKFDEAIEHFDRAIDLENARPPPVNVLPQINKALAMLQWRQDFSTAESLCRKAIETDPQCDVGINTLAQVLLQQNKVKDSAEMFELSAERGRTEMELQGAWSYVYATRAQLRFMETYPSYSEKAGLARVGP